MAIVRTDSTFRVAIEVANQLPSTPLAQVSGIALLVGELASIAPKLADSGSNDGYAWQTQIGDASASHTRTYDDYLSNGWTSNGSLKYAFSGSDLTNSAPGAGGVATRFSYSEARVETRNDPGFNGQYSYKASSSADIEYNRGAPAALKILKLSDSWSDRWAATGFENAPSGGNSESYGGTSSGTIRFVGVAEFDISSEDPTMLATTHFYSKKTVDSWRSEGSWNESASYGSLSTQFSLSSEAGLVCRYENSQYELSGFISALSYASRQASWSESNGSAGSFSRYYAYVDGASPDDDIDLAIITAYLRNTAEAANSYAVEVELFKGDDTIIVTDHFKGGNILAGAGNDQVIGGKADDWIQGGSGDDAITGGNGDDSLWGQEGDDVIKAGNGKDELGGGLGNDVLDGGAGHDWLSGDDGDDRLLGGAGNDRLQGDDGDDYLDGGAGNDELYGGEGADVLKGGAGNDLLKGNAGDDVIEGGAGNDYIEGGAGRDILSGGTGIDGFAFYAGDSGDGALSLGSLDQISGFSVSQDRILLDFAVDAGDIQQLGQGASYEALLADAEALGSRIVVGYDGANTYVFADMDGNGSLDLAIQLLGIKGDAVAQALQFERI